MSLTSYQKEFLEKLIAIPSVGGSPEPGAPYGKMPRKALDFFLEEASKAGFRTGVVGDRAGYVEFGKGDILYGLICHLDVVPEGDGWNTNPFELVLKDDPEYGPALYGRGIVDDKGPAAACFYAMKELLDEGKEPDNYRVRLILGTDEERSCSCVEYYAEHDEVPDFAITPDSEVPAVFCEKGILNIKISGKNENNLFAEGGSAVNMVPAKAFCRIGDKEITSKGVAAHASRPDLGVNAITALADAMEENGIDLEDYPIMKFVRDYEDVAFTGCSVNDVSGMLTSNIGTLKADENGCFIVIDLRVPLTYSFDDVLKHMQKRAARYGLKAEITLAMDPVFKDKDSEAVHQLTKIWNRHMDKFTGFKEEYRERYTEAAAIGGGTYARHIPNTIAFGPRAPWQTDECHQANEHICLSDFIELIKVLKEVIQNF